MTYVDSYRIHKQISQNFTVRPKQIFRFNCGVGFIVAERAKSMRDVAFLRQTKLSAPKSKLVAFSFSSHHTPAGTIFVHMSKSDMCETHTLTHPTPDRLLPCLLLRARVCVLL